MLQSEHRLNSSLDVIRPFIERISDSDDVQIMGGVGSAALAHPEVQISAVNKEVIIPSDFFLSTYREDGTLRDIDVLVLSSDKQRIKAVESTLQDTVGKQLEQSVFGFRPSGSLRMQASRPFGYTAIKTFLSDRYDNEDQPGVTKSLFPFSVEINPETLEPWSLIVEGTNDRIPIPNPATTLANYTNRSISGIRPRDTQKVLQASHNIFSAAPDLKEWLIDGPGKSQFELSRLIASLRCLKDEPPLQLFPGVELSTFPIESLPNHEAFMLPKLPEAARKRLIGVAAFKANALHSFESSGVIVSLWRRFGERHADIVVKNL